jgi:DHA1 family bicyclomycin/chloramphenicol resistance-like MFS transporter
LDYKEFIALMALMISITAMAIDMMLPALPEIGKDLSVTHPNDAQLVISVLILGMGVGQLVSGPLSDCFGRRPVIIIGFIIFILGCLISMFTSGFAAMLAGRFIQGFGAAGPRTAIVALVRDMHGGRAMARIMSAIMAVFILMPVMAPALGQGILLLASWRFIFGVLMLQAVLALVWFGLRQPETLPPKNRIPFSIRRIMAGLAEVFRNRLCLGYTLACGFITGVLLAYLNSAQQVFQEVYGLGKQFPLYMAIIAIFIGGASLLNSRIVMRFGMRTLAYRALASFIILAMIYLAITLLMGGHAPFWLMMVCFPPAFFCMGLLFGNLNAIAMEPLRHIAGIGAAVIGSLTSLISSPLSMVVGRCYDGSTVPLAWGFVVLSLFTLAAMRWADAGDTARTEECGAVQS